MNKQLLNQAEERHLLLEKLELTETKLINLQQTSIDSLNNLKEQIEYEKSQFENARLIFSKLISLDSTKPDYYFKNGYSLSMARIEHWNYRSRLR